MKNPHKLIKNKKIPKPNKTKENLKYNNTGEKKLKIRFLKEFLDFILFLFFFLILTLISKYILFLFHY